MLVEGIRVLERNNEVCRVVGVLRSPGLIEGFHEVDERRELSSKHGAREDIPRERRAAGDLLAGIVLDRPGLKNRSNVQRGMRRARHRSHRGDVRALEQRGEISLAVGSSNCEHRGVRHVIGRSAIRPQSARPLKIEKEKHLRRLPGRSFPQGNWPADIEAVLVEPQLSVRKRTKSLREAVRLHLVEKLVRVESVFAIELPDRAVELLASTLRVDRQKNPRIPAVLRSKVRRL